MMTPTTWTPEDADRIPHKPGCQGGRYMRFTGVRGDMLVKCRECGKWALVAPTADVPTIALSEPVEGPPLAAAGRYVCGLHTGVPVSWRGRGCRECADEHRARHRAKLAARAARRAARMAQS